MIWLLVACTGTPATTPAESTAPVSATAATSAIPVVPAQGAVAAPPAQSAAAGSSGAAAAPAPGAPPANAADFEPVSIPLGPREGGGVKWDGVKTKSMEPVDVGGGEVYDPRLETKHD